MAFSKQNVKNLYPLTPMQHGMLFHQLYEPDGPAYFCQFRYPLNGPIRLAVFKQAWQMLVDRHDILRTIFVHENVPEPLQIVLKQRQLDIHFEDLRALDGDAQRVAIEDRALLDRERGFQLSSEMLLRIALYQLGEASYQVQLSFHHILLDGWSLGLLETEFGQIYNELCAGRTPYLAPTAPYASYVKWLKAREEQTSLDWWEQYLAGYEQPVSLPFERLERPATQLPFENLEAHLDEAETAALQRFAVSQDATLNDLCQTIWAVLLGIYNNVEDVVFGATVSGRDIPVRGVEAMVGLFINSIPVRIQPKAGMRVTQLLQKTRDLSHDLRQHQHLPLMTIQKRTQLKGDLVDSVMAFENYPASLDETQVTQPGQTDVFEQTNYDYGLVLMPGPCLGMKLNFSPNRFDAVQMRQIPLHFKTLANAMVRNPVALIESLDFLDASARKALLESALAPAAQTQANLVSAFSEQVQRHLDQPAVMQGDTQLSYAELQKRVAHLASHLQTRGVVPNSVVAIYLKPGPDLMVAALAVLHCGGIFTVLDTSFPKQRIKAMLNCARADLVISHSTLKTELEAFELARIYLDSLPPTQTAWTAVATSADDSAYIVFTSGSTGEPKGILVPQRALLNLIAWRGNCHDYRPGAVVMPLLSPSFDSFLADAFGALCHGAALYIVESETRRDAEALGSLMLRKKVTHIALVPVLYQILLDQAPASVAGLRAVVLGGEALPPSLLKRHFEVCPQTRILNEYGPSETCVTASCYELQSPDQAIRIGSAIAGAALYVVDRHFRLLPAGVPGELVIGGAGLANGYLGQAAQTAAAFVPNPFAENQRLYRSGDRVRWSGAGLQFLGRNDGQVKVRGFRIELAEISRRLQAIAGIEGAVVRAVGEPARLLAWILAEPSIDVESVREQLGQTLPSYMVPAQVVVLDAFPTTPLGKIDFKALPMPETSAVAVPDAAPQTVLECLLAEVFGQILGNQQIGLHDDYYACGGDSIKAIQITSRLRGKGYRCDVRNIFDNPTIARLAQVIKRDIREIPQQPVVGKLPLTPIQRWCFETFGEHASYFNMSMRLIARTPFQVPALKAAIAKIWDHHDALRLVFETRADGTVIAINRSNEVAPYFEEVRLNGPDHDAELEAFGAKLQASFDLKRGPLFKWTLVHDQDQDHLLMTVHHGVIDAVSWRIVAEDLENLYQQALAQQSLKLPTKTHSFKTWAERQHAFARDPKLQEALPFWQANAAKTVTLFEREGTPGARINHRFHLDAQATERLRLQAGKAYNTNVEDMLLSGLARAVQGVLPTAVVPVMLEGHGREALFEDLDISRTVGWFTAMYPVILPTASTLQPGDHLKAVKDCLRQIPARGVHYGILRYLGAEEIRGSLEQVCEPQINFNYLGVVASDSDADDAMQLTGHPGRDVHETIMSLYPLSVIAYIGDQGLEVELMFRNGVLSPDQMRHLTKSYERALHDLIDHCCGREHSEITTSDVTCLALSSDQLDALLEQVSGQTDLDAKREVVDIYPLSPLQDGMLFHALYDPKSTAYFEQMHYRICGDLRPQIFEAAWNQVFARHDILRTVFVPAKGQRPLQVVLKNRRVDFDYHDWRNFDAAKQHEALQDYLVADRERGFDLTRDVLLRVRIFQTGADQYRFVWSQHHILMDGWCLGIIQDEVMTAYQALLAGTQPEFTSVRPYSHYIQWLENQDREASQNYWQTYLDGVDEGTKAPFKLESEALAEKQMAMDVFSLGAARSAEVRQLASQLGMTLNTLLQTVWGLLLQRYNGSRDAVFAATVSGRPPIEGVEQMVGLFINAIPVRVELRAGESFADLAKRMQTQALESEAYHFHSLAEIQAESPLKQGLLDHLMIFENYPFSEPDAESRAAFVIDDVQAREETNYGFQIAVLPNEDIEFQIAYDLNRYPQAGMASIANHFKAMFAALVANPQQRPDTIDITQGQLPAQLKTAMTGLAAEPRHATLTQWFESHLAGREDKPAIAAEDGELSFGQLERAANRLAHRLRALGIQTNQLVGVMPGRTTQIAVSMLAVLKSGAAFVAMDENHPSDRLRAQIKDCAMVALLHQMPLAADLDIDIPCIALSDPSLLNEPETAPSPIHCGTDLSHVIYTSGSTGKPKAVLLEHRAAVNFVTGIDTLIYSQLEPGDAVALMAAITFDASFQQIWPALLLGYPLHVVPIATKQHGVQLLQWLTQHEIALMDGTPSLVALMVESGLATANQLRLKHAIIGGEAFPAPLLDAFYQNPALANCWVHNAYGPSECCVDTTIHSFSQHDTGRNQLPIGQPLNNVQLEILDTEGLPVPLGVAGELYVGGPGLARGYLDHPDQETRFLQTTRGRRYRSGDLVRWNFAGELEFLGRIDRQIKVRGHRIEPAEVEHALLAHSGLQRVTVAVLNQELVAWFSGDPNLSSSQLRSHLLASLPTYMLPSHYFHIAEFPLTTSGKVDLKQLLAMDAEALSVANQFEAPRDDFEQKMASLWEAVLDKTPIGRHDNFFDLGGHSLKALSLTSRIEQAGLPAISMVDLFAHPTIASLSDLVKQGQQRTSQKLFPLRPSLADATALFFLPPVSGTSTFYKGLAEKLDRGLNPYGLQCPGFAENEAFCRDIDELVTAFKTQIESQQPQGPLLLAGYSMGVNLAMEVALRFEAEGRAVTLFLIDGGLREGRGQAPETAYADQLRDAHYWDDVVALYTQGLAKSDFGRIEALINHHFALFEKGYRFEDQLKADLYCFEASANQSTTNMASLERTTQGKTEVVLLDGDHYSIFAASHLDQLANQFNQALALSLGTLT